MADNVRIPLGTEDGATLALDDVGGIHYPRSKISLGSDGTAVDAVAGAGAVDSGTQRVTLASDDPAVVDLAAIEVILTTIEDDTYAVKTAVQLIDNAIAGTEMQVDIVAALPSGANAIGKLAANSGVDIGDVDVTSIAAGSNLIGDVSLQPRTTGGLTMSKTTSAASDNATSLKASAGQIYAIQVFNVNAAVRYLKLYNKASAPTVGTDVPVKTLAIPGNTAGAGMVLAWPQGLGFDTGIAFALTTESTDAGTTGVSADEITVNIDYK